MRTMYDSVNPSAIPTTAQMVAGYVDGRYAWSAADWARFPSAVHVRIAVFPSTNDGVVLDVELGDATPAQAPGWVLMRRAAGVDPSVYCSQAAWPSVQAAFTAAHVAQPHYWIAAYPGGGAGTVPAGAVAHQYADPQTSGGNWDLSAVADYWPGVDSGPQPNSQVSNEEDDMPFWVRNSKGDNLCIYGERMVADVDGLGPIPTNGLVWTVGDDVYNNFAAKEAAAAAAEAALIALPAALNALGTKFDAILAALKALPASPTPAEVPIVLHGTGSWSVGPNGPAPSTTH